jgi:hypothetical protein
VADRVVRSAGGAARLSAAGRWKLEIELDGETVSLPFQSGSP